MAKARQHRDCVAGGRIAAALAAIAFAHFLSGCANGPEELLEVSSITLSSGPAVPGKPVEAYVRIARGLKGCWLGLGKPLGAGYVFTAEMRPADKGGSGVIVIFEREATGERGVRAFEIGLEPDGVNTKLGQSNLKVPEPYGKQMLGDVERWAGGETGCGSSPGWVPAVPTDVPK